MRNKIYQNKVSFVPSDELDGPAYFGWSVSPFGRCVILLQSESVIGLAFKNGQTDDQIENSMKARWLQSITKFKRLNMDRISETIFLKNLPIKISFSGSQLQTEVWKALLEIPAGTTATYSHITSKTNHSRAVRAVASAIGQNPIAWLIPCHRVIRKSGELGGYRWGLKIKEMMLLSETKI